MRSARPPIPRELSLSLRLRFALTRMVTAVLRQLGLREMVIAYRTAAQRTVRQLFERFGSARYSHPALHAMDRTLDQIIDRDGGFFVEAGGFDGFTQSNTYYLERFRGWQGILIEPMHELAALARANRPAAQILRYALVGPEHDGTDVEMEFGDLMTSVSGLHESDWSDSGLVLGWRDRRTEHVPARTLSALLDATGSPAIDLLSLDIEGYEAVALSGLDLDRHAPAWILVEIHDLDAGRAAVGEVLGDRYVEHGQISPLDVLYRRLDGSSSSSSSGTARRASTSRQ
ncbi:MAG: FkbM family methyltransferase [Actinomycetota bacterium]|nr:FkbM family methyltransferase [Actinomycetota bacterium]